MNVTLSLSPSMGQSKGTYNLISWEPRNLCSYVPLDEPIRKPIPSKAEKQLEVQSVLSHRGWKVSGKEFALRQASLSRLSPDSASEPCVGSVIWTLLWPWAANRQGNKFKWYMKYNKNENSLNKINVCVRAACKKKKIKSHLTGR